MWVRRALFVFSLTLTLSRHTLGRMLFMSKCHYFTGRTIYFCSHYVCVFRETILLYADITARICTLLRRRIAETILGHVSRRDRTPDRNRMPDGDLHIWLMWFEADTDPIIFEPHHGGISYVHWGVNSSFWLTWRIDVFGLEFFFSKMQTKIKYIL